MAGREKASRSHLFLLLLLLFVSTPGNSSASTIPAPGGHLPILYGGDNRQPYPSLSPVDVPLVGERLITDWRVTVAPSPFRTSLAIRFALPLGQHGSVEILDVTGRSIRRLHATGEGTVAHVLWDGNARTGRRASPGIYFVRVTVAGQVRVTRTVRLQ